VVVVVVAVTALTKVPCKYVPVTVVPLITPLTVASFCTRRPLTVVKPEAVIVEKVLVPLTERFPVTVMFPLKVAPLVEG